MLRLDGRKEHNKSIWKNGVEEILFCRCTAFCLSFTVHPKGFLPFLCDFLFSCSKCIQSGLLTFKSIAWCPPRIVLLPGSSMYSPQWQ